jgi:predicted methyltransferase MtxX (methanogen marker protein 4)
MLETYKSIGFPLILRISLIFFLSSSEKFLLTQVILDEDKYEDDSIEVIALSNALDRLKSNKGHLFPIILL